MITALWALGALALVFGAILGYAAIRFKVEADPLVDQIDDILPQTQCGQCGYPGCRPYAEAIAGGDIITKCPPGGEATIKKLADLMGVSLDNLDSSQNKQEKRVAYIREEDCIGCTKCIQACPVDAIVGASKQMHTILSNECTGCDLCVEPCPVNCIEMRPVQTTAERWKWDLQSIPVHVVEVK